MRVTSLVTCLLLLTGCEAVDALNSNGGYVSHRTETGRVCSEWVDDIDNTGQSVQAYLRAVERCKGK